MKSNVLAKVGLSILWLVAAAIFVVCTWLAIRENIVLGIVFGVLAISGAVCLLFMMKGKEKT